MDFFWWCMVAVGFILVAGFLEERWENRCTKCKSWFANWPDCVHDGCNELYKLTNGSYRKTLNVRNIKNELSYGDLRPSIILAEACLTDGVIRVPDGVEYVPDGGCWHESDCTNCPASVGVIPRRNTFNHALPL